jgi:hypothetical protein
MITDKTDRQKLRIKEFDKLKQDGTLSLIEKKLCVLDSDDTKTRDLKRKLKLVFLIEIYSIEAKKAESACETVEKYTLKTNKIKRLLRDMNNSEFFIRRDCKKYFLLFVSLGTNVCAFHFSGVKISHYGTHTIENKYFDTSDTSLCKIVNAVLDNF